MLLRAYFDDSGTHKSSRVIVLGGLIGSPEQWEQFTAAWTAKLAAPLSNKPPLRSFHLSHCNSGKGEFLDYTEAEQDAVTHDFRQIIIDAKLEGVAWAIDRRAWTDLAQARFGDPLPYVAEQCVVWGLGVACRPPVAEAVAVYFDGGIHTDALHNFLEPQTYQMGRPRVSVINWPAVDVTPPLQGADIVATENYWHMAEVLRLGKDAQPRPHMRHYLANMVHEGRMLDRLGIEGLP